jgi:formylglycine-generating enzyme required for sulfatase activity
MVLVPGGKFEMGSDVSDGLAEEDEFPRQSVTLGGFWIDRFVFSGTPVVTSTP